MGELAQSPSQPEVPDTDKKAALSAFIGHVGDATVVELHDAETVDHWRGATPAAHAEAMAELSNYAEGMVVVTGFGKPADEQFPGFPTPKAA